MANEIKQTIRLEPGLDARLSKAADRDHRSKHGQMLHYIERGLDQDDGQNGEPDGAPGR